MSKKVLVFESDAAFAAELRSELGKLGCTTLIVDDGNVGLQQAATERPDLILLSIELPRMNGFSVCNKLKKDAALKDVPLIIMSSESSEETFEQHRKLRTRAEDYVHKPIAFGELLRHINPFVQLGDANGPTSDGVIVIDDELSLSGMDLSIDEPDSTRSLDDDHTQIGARPAFFANKSPSLDNVDADVDAFADAAFGRLTGDVPAAPAAQPQPSKPRRSVPPPLAAPLAEVKPLTLPEVPASRRPTSPPPPAPSILNAGPSVDSAEVEKLRAESESLRKRTAELDREIAEAKAEASRLAMEGQRATRSDADVQRLHRELDEMKSKLSTNAKAGAVSSREFLDLREGLNKKDKELLALREQLTKKDKEIVEIQDRSLALERSKADLEDRSLELERENESQREKVEALAADKELAKKVGDDFKQRAERYRADLDGKTKEVADLKAKAAEERAASEAAVAAAKAEADARAVQEATEHSAALAALEASHKADSEKASSAAVASLLAAKEAAAKEKADALAAKEAALRAEHAADIAARDRASQAELDALRKATAEELIQTKVGAEQRREADVRSAEELAAKQLGERAAVHASEVSSLEAAHKEASTAAAKAHKEERAVDARMASEKLEQLRTELSERVLAVENDRDARLFALEAKAKAELGDANDAARIERDKRDERISLLELELDTVRGDLATATEQKRAGDEAALAAAADLEAKLSSETLARKAALRQRDELSESLAASEAQVSALTADLAASRQEAADFTLKMQAESLLLSQARAKWAADKASLEQASQSISAALRQIAEATNRPFAE